MEFKYKDENEYAAGDSLRVEVPTSWSPQIIELGFNASLIIELIMDSKFLP